MTTKWAVERADVDNDFSLRLGVLESAPLDAAAQEKVEANLRAYLSRILPLVIEVGLAEVSIVAYEDPRLPLETSEPWPLTDPRVTGELIAMLSCSEDQANS